MTGVAVALPRVKAEAVPLATPGGSPTGARLPGARPAGGNGLGLGAFRKT